MFWEYSFCSGCTFFGDQLLSGKIHGNLQRRSYRFRCRKKNGTLDCFAASVAEAHRKKESGEILRDLQTLADACDLQGLGGDDFDAMVEAVDLNSLGGGFDLNDWPYGDVAALSPSVVPSPLRTPSPCMEPPPLTTPSPLREPSPINFTPV